MYTYYNLSRLHVRPTSLQGIPVMRAWKNCTSSTSHGVGKLVPKPGLVDIYFKIPTAIFVVGLYQSSWGR
jgi:hypothetical protein